MPEGKYSETINTRIEPELLNVIDDYALITSMSRSDAIRQFLKIGVKSMATIALRRRFMDRQNKRWINLDKNKPVSEPDNLIFARDNFKCRKCKSEIDLISYHIDKNPSNGNPNMIITLCKNCKESAEKYSPQSRVTDDFIEWFFNI